MTKVFTFVGAVLALFLLWGCSATDLFSQASKLSTASQGRFYTVTYMTNGGSGAFFCDANRYSQQSLVTVLGNSCGIVKANYLFTGWNTAPDGSGTSYAQGGQLVMPAGDVVLYAVWASTGTLSISGTSITQGATAPAGTLIIPPGMTTIGASGFLNSSGITQVLIPSSVVTIDHDAFNGCTALTSVTICGNNLTTIGYNAFDGCVNLKTINIPNSVKTIGNTAFNTCSSLTSINLPEGLISIDFWAFHGCSSLTSVTLPSTLTSLGYNSFGNSGLTSVTIPAAVTSIGDVAFQGLSNLTRVTMLSSTPPTLGGTGVFSGANASCQIHVPSGTVSAYQTATNWTAFASMIVSP